MQSNVPKLYERMVNADVMETMSLNFIVPQRYIMPIFTCTIPVDLSKHIFDLFLWEKSGETCLMRLIAKCFRHVEPRCLQMEEDKMFDFISKGTFIQTCFEELSLVELFLDA